MSTNTETIEDAVSDLLKQSDKLIAGITFYLHNEKIVLALSEDLRLEEIAKLVATYEAKRESARDLAKVLITKA